MIRSRRNTHTKLTRLAAVASAFVFVAAACGGDDDDDADGDSPAPVETADDSTDDTQATTDVGADGSGSDAEPSDDALTLSIWSREATRGTIEPIIAAYNELGGNQIEATFVPNEQFIANFGAAIAGGDSPDLVSIDLIYTPSFIDAGQLQPLGDLLDELSFADTLSPAHMTLGTGLDGDRYAVPFAAEGSVLAYNKGLFEAAGLDPEAPPATWDEIYSAAEAVTAIDDDTYGFWLSGACAGCNAFTFAPLIWATGGDVLSDDFLSPTLDSDPAVAEALDFYRRMWDAGFMPADAEVDDGALFLNAFAGGNVGMVGTGAFAIGGLKADFPDVDFGLTFLPGNTAGSASSFAGGDHIAIPAGSEHREDAWDFIQWVLQEEQQLAHYAANGQLPLRTDLADNEYFDAEPRLKVAAEAMALGNTPYSLVYNDLFNDPNGPWLQMLQEAVFDGDVDGAVTRAQERFEEIMES